MNDIEISILLLKNKCGEVLANKEQYAVELFTASYRYLIGNGCDNRQEYENLVNYLINIEDYKNTLLTI